MSGPFSFHVYRVDRHIFGYFGSSHRKISGYPIESWWARRASVTDVCLPPSAERASVLTDTFWQETFLFVAYSYKRIIEHWHSWHAWTLNFWFFLIYRPTWTEQRIKKCISPIQPHTRRRWYFVRTFLIQDCSHRLSKYALWKLLAWSPVNFSW